MGKPETKIPLCELYCEKCDTANPIYPDMKPPFLCTKCGNDLGDIDFDELEYEHNEGQYDPDA